MKILLIAGHGNGDPGAVGNGYKESELTREVVSLVKPFLSRFDGVTVDIADPSKNWYDYICKKGNTFNFRSYDYVLEVHFNAGVGDTTGNGKTTGTEIYITTIEKGATVEENILNGIVLLGFKNRGVKRKNWTLINHIKKQGVSAALLEVCFIDDKDDMKLYSANVDEIASAIANGIKKGFGLKEKVAQSTELTSVNDIVWELANRGIISDKSLWLKKLEEDKNAYWLARKCANYIVLFKTKKNVE